MKKAERTKLVNNFLSTKLGKNANRTALLYSQTCNISNGDDPMDAFVRQNGSIIPFRKVTNNRNGRGKTIYDVFELKKEVFLEGKMILPISFKNKFGEDKVVKKPATELYRTDVALSSFGRKKIMSEFSFKLAKDKETYEKQISQLFKDNGDVRTLFNSWKTLKEFYLKATDEEISNLLNKFDKECSEKPNEVGLAIILEGNYVVIDVDTPMTFDEIVYFMSKYSKDYDNLIVQPSSLNGHVHIFISNKNIGKTSFNNKKQVGLNFKLNGKTFNYDVRCPEKNIIVIQGNGYDNMYMIQRTATFDTQNVKNQEKININKLEKIIPVTPNVPSFGDLDVNFYNEKGRRYSEKNSNLGDSLAWLGKDLFKSNLNNNITKDALIKIAKIFKKEKTNLEKDIRQKRVIKTNTGEYSFAGINVLNFFASALKSVNTDCFNQCFEPKVILVNNLGEEKQLKENELKFNISKDSLDRFNAFIKTPDKKELNIFRTIDIKDHYRIAEDNGKKIEWKKFAYLDESEDTSYSIPKYNATIIDKETNKPLTIQLEKIADTNKKTYIDENGLEKKPFNKYINPNNPQSVFLSRMFELQVKRAIDATTIVVNSDKLIEKHEIVPIIKDIAATAKQLRHRIENVYSWLLPLMDKIAKAYSLSKFIINKDENNYVLANDIQEELTDQDIINIYKQADDEFEKNDEVKGLYNNTLERLKFGLIQTLNEVFAYTNGNLLPINFETVGSISKYTRRTSKGQTYLTDDVTTLIPSKKYHWNKYGMNFGRYFKGEVNPTKNLLTPSAWAPVSIGYNPNLIKNLAKPTIQEYTNIVKEEQNELWRGIVGKTWDQTNKDLNTAKSKFVYFVEDVAKLWKNTDEGKDLLDYIDLYKALRKKMGYEKFEQRRKELKNRNYDKLVDLSGELDFAYQNVYEKFRTLSKKHWKPASKDFIEARERELLYLETLQEKNYAEIDQKYRDIYKDTKKAAKKLGRKINYKKLKQARKEEIKDRVENLYGVGILTSEILRDYVLINNHKVAMPRKTIYDGRTEYSITRYHKLKNKAESARLAIESMKEFSRKVIDSIPRTLYSDVVKKIENNMLHKSEPTFIQKNAISDVYLVKLISFSEFGSKVIETELSKSENSLENTLLDLDDGLLLVRKFLFKNFHNASVIDSTDKYNAVANIMLSGWYYANIFAKDLATFNTKSLEKHKEENTIPVTTFKKLLLNYQDMYESFTGNANLAQVPYFYDDINRSINANYSMWMNQDDRDLYYDTLTPKQKDRDKTKNVNSLVCKKFYNTSELFEALRDLFFPKDVNFRLNVIEKTDKYSKFTTAMRYIKNIVKSNQFKNTFDSINYIFNKFDSDEEIRKKIKLCSEMEHSNNSVRIGSKKDILNRRRSNKYYSVNDYILNAFSDTDVMKGIQIEVNKYPKEKRTPELINNIRKVAYAEATSPVIYKHFYFLDVEESLLMSKYGYKKVVSELASVLRILDHAELHNLNNLYGLDQIKELINDLYRLFNLVNDGYSESLALEAVLNKNYEVFAPFNNKDTNIPYDKYACLEKAKEHQLVLDYIKHKEKLKDFNYDYSVANSKVIDTISEFASKKNMFGQGIFFDVNSSSNVDKRAEFIKARKDHVEYRNKKRLEGLKGIKNISDSDNEPEIKNTDVKAYIDGLKEDVPELNEVDFNNSPKKIIESLFENDSIIIRGTVMENVGDLRGSRNNLFLNAAIKLRNLKFDINQVAKMLFIVNSTLDYSIPKSELNDILRSAFKADPDNVSKYEQMTHLSNRGDIKTRLSSVLCKDYLDKSDKEWWAAEKEFYLYKVDHKVGVDAITELFGINPFKVAYNAKRKKLDLPQMDEAYLTKLSFDRALPIYVSLLTGSAKVIDKKTGEIIDLSLRDKQDAYLKHADVAEQWNNLLINHANRNMFQKKTKAGIAKYNKHLVELQSLFNDPVSLVNIIEIVQKNKAIDLYSQDNSRYYIQCLDPKKRFNTPQAVTNELNKIKDEALDVLYLTSKHNYLSREEFKQLTKAYLKTADNRRDLFKQLRLKTASRKNVSKKFITLFDKLDPTTLLSIFKLNIENHGKKGILYQTINTTDKIHQLYFDLILKNAQNRGLCDTIDSNKDVSTKYIEIKQLLADNIYKSKVNEDRITRFEFLKANSNKLEFKLKNDKGNDYLDQIKKLTNKKYFDSGGKLVNFRNNKILS